jgi:predicted ATP-grasp superfamily ATP-dependent carboligase
MSSSTKINQTQQPEAIVCTSGAGINALSIIRSLGRAGVPVHIIAVNPDENLATKSRYCTSQLKLVSIDPKTFLNTVLTVAQRCQGKPVLYVDNDKMLSLMMAIEKELADVVLFTSIPGHISKLLDKKNQIALASAAGLSVPESWFPANWDDFTAMKSQSGQRLIAKTRFPVANRNNPFKVLSAIDGETLRDKLRMFSLAPDDLFIQEYIEGGDDDVFFALCYAPLHSKQAAVVTGQKLVQSGSGDGGVMVLGVTEPNESIRKLSLKMIHSLDYKGYFGIEFKYCKSRKEYFFIEVNTRTERFNGLGHIANLDLNIVSYLDASGQDTRQYIETIQQAGVWIDGRKFLEALYHRREWSGFIYLLKSLIKRKEWAVFTFDDTKPFLYSFMQHK